MKVDFLDKHIPYEVYEPTDFKTPGVIQYSTQEKRYIRSTEDVNGRYTLDQIEPIII